MRHIAFVASLAIALLLLACGTAPPVTGPAEEIRTPTPAPLPTSFPFAPGPTPIALTDLKVVELGSDFWPTDLSGDRVVGWGRDGEVYMANVWTGELQRLTEDGTPKRQPVISGDIVAWTDQRRQIETSDSGSRTGRGLADDVFVLDLNSGESRRITEVPAKRSGLIISGNRLVWQDNRNESDEHYTHTDIYTYDLETDEETAVVIAPGAQHWVAIDGDRIVWADNRNSPVLGTDRSGCFECPDNRFDIYLYDFTTGEERVLDESGVNNTMPDIHGNRVVWRDFDDEGRTAIRLYDIDTGERRTLGSPSLSGVDPPLVSGDYAAWTVGRACDVVDFPPMELPTGAFVYDLLTGEVMQLSNYVEPSVTLDGTVVVVHEACQVGGRAYAVFLAPDDGPSESGDSRAATPAPIPTAIGTSSPEATTPPSPAASPTAAPTPVEPTAREALANTIRDPMARIADRVPGFGGVFRDPRTNTVYIYLQDASRLEDAKRVLTEVFGADFLEGREVQVLEGEYSMLHLAAWYRDLNDVIGKVEGVMMTDLDEGQNRIEIRMQPRRGAREEMEAAIASVNVPLGAVVIDVGCSGVKPWPLDDANPPGEAFVRAVEYSLEVEDRASYGETVSMKLILRNVSDEPVDFFTGDRPPHDFVVSKPDGEQVWHWKCAKWILLPLDGQTLGPGEEMEFTGEWEQVDNRGAPVPPGVYLLRGVLDMEPPEMLVTEAREVEILR